MLLEFVCLVRGIYCLLKTNTLEAFGGISIGTNISIFWRPSWLAEEMWLRVIGWIGSWVIARFALGKNVLDKLARMVIAECEMFVVYSLLDLFMEMLWIVTVGIGVEMSSELRRIRCMGLAREVVIVV